MATPRSSVGKPSARSRAISSACATIPAPRPESSLSTRSWTSTAQPARRSKSPLSSPLIEPPTIIARFKQSLARLLRPDLFVYPFNLYMTPNRFGGFPMALTMLDKTAEKKGKSQWPAEIAAEFERESKNPNPCVGSTLLSENERTRVWIIRLAPGERIGFHRHVLDYFWTSVSGGRARQHVHDGTTVEYSYQPGETRHESYGKGEFKVHDLENLDDREMVFMTVEFKDSANQPMKLPAGVRPQSAAA